VYPHQGINPGKPDTERGNDMAKVSGEDRRTPGGQWRRGSAADPVGTKARIAGRLTCGHYVQVGDRIVNRGNGWLCGGCAEVVTTKRPRR
jgi:hypothetical protein